MRIHKQHPDYNFFSFRSQAVYFITSSIISRLMTVFMYGLFYYNDGKMRQYSEIKEHLPPYSHKQVYHQVRLQVFSMLLACLLFTITVLFELSDNHHNECDDRRKLDTGMNVNI